MRQINSFSAIEHSKQFLAATQKNISALLHFIRNYQFADNQLLSGITNKLSLDTKKIVEFMLY